MLTVILNPNVWLDAWGYLIDFMDEKDPRPIKEQFNSKYLGGWNKFDEFELNKETMELTYPGDPPLSPISAIQFRDEQIYLYPHAWVMIMQKDGSHEVARMD